MKKSRAILVIGHLAMLLAIAMWVYSSYRYDALNIGGVAGNVDFWISAGDLSFYIGMILWALCIIASACIAWAKKIESIYERVFWCTFSIAAAPVIAFGLHAIFNASVQVKI